METQKEVRRCCCGQPQSVLVSDAGDLQIEKTLKTARNKGYDVVPCRVNIYGFLQKILK
ncbi:MAG: hypothetical protein V7K67_00510 [Nostoc sp.]|uniref:hypothetical protein n=1 Tax=Nostoc sp. TaxID=1180 RepID=UPI002FF2910E